MTSPGAGIRIVNGPINTHPCLMICALSHSDASMHLVRDSPVAAASTQRAAAQGMGFGLVLGNILS